VSPGGLVLADEREEKPPAVRQNQFLCPNGPWWHLPGNLWASASCRTPRIVQVQSRGGYLGRPGSVQDGDDFTLKEADIMVIFDNPATVPAPAGGYSHVARVELGDRTLLQLSGQVAIDADRKIVGGNDMAAQADFIMDNITAILAAHGASLADVVNIRTFLTDMGQLPEYGKVRAARFTGTPPTITTVEVSRLWVPGALLEVEVLAIT
jgi:2-iminobutanoate/2-iminopropanoate deaminase